MRVQVLAFGRLKDGPERDLAERYRERAAALGRPLGFAGPDVVELAESRGRRPEERRGDEARRLLARAGPARLVLLDETAPSLDSERFAARIGGMRDAGQGPLAFVIGGPDGLDPAVRGGAADSLSFGRLTLPHQLVRVLVLEQLYRAFTILAGHPYHRAGDGGA